MAHRLTSPLTRDIALHCDDETGRPMAFMATFHYDALDPWAVGVTFHVAGGDVPWTMARELLQRGMGEAAGDGDIRLQPTMGADGCAMVTLVFHSPEGRLEAAARTSDLMAFLLRSWAMVPPGSESELIDLDAWIRGLRP